MDTPQSSHVDFRIFSVWLPKMLQRLLSPQLDRPWDLTIFISEGLCPTCIIIHRFHMLSPPDIILVQGHCKLMKTMTLPWVLQHLLRKEPLCHTHVFWSSDLHYAILSSYRSYASAHHSQPVAYLDVGVCSLCHLDRL